MKGCLPRRWVLIWVVIRVLILIQGKTGLGNLSLKFINFQCSSLGLVLKLTLLSQPVTMESNSKHDLVTSISCASGTIYIFLCSDLQL